MIVLPPDFSHIRELDKALISVSRDNDINDKKVSIPSDTNFCVRGLCFCT